MSPSGELSFYRQCLVDTERRRQLLNGNDEYVPFAVTAAASAAVDMTTNITECVADKIQLQHETSQSNIMNLFLVFAGALVFFMQVGFAMLCAGCVRKKNVQK